MPKSSGKGLRPLCEFGPKRKALHLLCGDLLRSSWSDRPFNYLQRGKGADKAANAVVNMMAAGSKSWVVIADIQDFFPSVQLGGLQDLCSLPKDVVRVSMTIPDEAPLVLLSHPDYHCELHGAVRVGIPQGSTASNLVASMLLGKVLEQIAPANQLVLYGDDMLVLAGDEHEAKSFAEALNVALEAHPCGPFRLKLQVQPMADGVEFLKYRHEIDGWTGEVHTRPSSKSYYRYKERLKRLSMESEAQNAEFDYTLYEESWVKAFPLWKPNDVSRALLLLTTFEAIDEALSPKKDASL